MAEWTFPREYVWPLRVSSYQIGADRTLRPSDMLKLQQEIGNRHLADGGLTVPVLLEMGVAFVMARTNCVIHRAPMMDEQVTLTSWQREIAGSKFHRCYSWTAADGAPLIDSVSTFVLVDIENHRPVRPSVLTAQGIELSWDRQSCCPDPEKIVLPPSMADVGERAVRWSDTDFNGHVNNTVYADLLCDFLPEDARGRRMTGFSICFLREARQGDTLRMIAAMDKDAAFVAADHARGRSFEATATFAP